MKSLKKYFFDFFSFSVVSFNILLISCGVDSSQKISIPGYEISPSKPIPWKRDIFEKLNGDYYELHSPSKTLLNGVLKYNPKRVDEIKNKLIDSINFVHDKDYDIYEYKMTDQIRFIFGFDNQDLLLNEKKHFFNQNELKKVMTKIIQDNNFGFMMLNNKLNEFVFRTTPAKLSGGSYNPYKRWASINFSIYKSYVSNKTREMSINNLLQIFAHENIHLQDNSENFNTIKKYVSKENNTHVSNYINFLQDIDKYAFNNFVIDNFNYKRYPKKNYYYDYYYNNGEKHYWTFSPGKQSVISFEGIDNDDQRFNLSEIIAQIGSQYTSTLIDNSFFYKEIFKDNKTNVFEPMAEINSLLYYSNYNFYDYQIKKQEEIIMSSLFKNIYGVNNHDSFTLDGDIVTFRSYDGSNMEKILITNKLNNQSKEFNIEKHDIPFVFHGRPFDSHQDYKYIANAAFKKINLQDEFGNNNLNNFEFKIFKKDNLLKNNSKILFNVNNKKSRNQRWQEKFNMKVDNILSKSSFQYSYSYSQYYYQNNEYVEII